MWLNMFQAWFGNIALYPLNSRLSLRSSPQNQKSQITYFWTLSWANFKPNENEKGGMGFTRIKFVSEGALLLTDNLWFCAQLELYCRVRNCAVRQLYINWSLPFATKINIFTFKTETERTKFQIYPLDPESDRVASHSPWCLEPKLLAIFKIVSNACAFCPGGWTGREGSQ